MVNVKGRLQPYNRSQVSEINQVDRGRSGTLQVNILHFNLQIRQTSELKASLGSKVIENHSLEFSHGSSLYIILNTFKARLSLTDSEGMLGTEVLGSSVSFSALMTRANRNIRSSLQQIPPV